jgi:hypothetical protein
MVTPVLAALAGAEVYAFTRNTKYGTVEEVREKTNALGDVFHDKKLKISVIDKVTPDIISKADIITNSGHLRPLNSEILQFAKRGAVIPLMYEAWEWRKADLDLAYCKERGIIVAATNERHPAIDVFNYLGDMALKLIFEAGICTYKNSFVLLCNNDFGPYIAKVLSKVCGSLGVCDTIKNKEKYKGLEIDWLGDFPDIDIPEKYCKSEALIFTAYPFEKTWIGDKMLPINVEALQQAMPGAKLLRYAGHIDEDMCKRYMHIYPESVRPGHMGILPSAIGFDPIIRLQSGGLKVGEALINGNYEYDNVPILELL